MEKENDLLEDTQVGLEFRFPNSSFRIPSINHQTGPEFGIWDGIWLAGFKFLLFTVAVSNFYLSAPASSFAKQG